MKNKISKRFTAYFLILMLVFTYMPETLHLTVKAADVPDIPIPTVSADASVWDGVFPTSYPLKGKGRKNDPYLIDSAAALAYIVYKSNTVATFSIGKFFKITTDIILNPEGSVIDSSGNFVSSTPKYKWESIGKYMDKPFCGIIDGGGHTISGMYIEEEHDNNSKRNFGGFIANYTPYADSIINNDYAIKDLNIENSYVNQDMPWASIFVGMFSSDSSLSENVKAKLQNCNIYNSILDSSLTKNTTFIGVMGQVRSTSYNACLVGYNSFRGILEISDCKIKNVKLQNHGQDDWAKFYCEYNGICYNNDNSSFSGTLNIRDCIMKNVSLGCEEYIYDSSTQVGTSSGITNHLRKGGIYNCKLIDCFLCGEKSVSGIICSINKDEADITIEGCQLIENILLLDTTQSESSGKMSGVLTFMRGSKEKVNHTIYINNNQILGNEISSSSGIYRMSFSYILTVPSQAGGYCNITNNYIRDNEYIHAGTSRIERGIFAVNGNDSFPASYIGACVYVYNNIGIDSYNLYSDAYPRVTNCYISAPEVELTKYYTTCNRNYNGYGSNCYEQISYSNKSSITMSEVITKANAWVAANTSESQEYLTWYLGSDGYPAFGVGARFEECQPDDPILQTPLVVEGKTYQPVTSYTLVNPNGEAPSYELSPSDGPFIFNTVGDVTTIYIDPDKEKDLTTGNHPYTITLTAKKSPTEDLCSTTKSYTLIKVDATPQIKAGPTIISGITPKVQLKLFCPSYDKVKSYKLYKGATLYQTVTNDSLDTNHYKTIEIPLTDYNNLSVSSIYYKSSNSENFESEKVNLPAINLTANSSDPNYLKYSISAYTYTELSTLKTQAQAISKVNVETSAGLIEGIPVTWDWSTITPSYDKTKVQTYKVLGNLDLSNYNLTNTLSIRPELTIVITDRTISSSNTDYPSDSAHVREVSVPYKSSATVLAQLIQDANATTNIYDSEGSIIYPGINIDWEYEGKLNLSELDSSGTVIYGTLSLPTGVSISDKPALLVKVIPTSINSTMPVIPKIVKPVYTALSKLGLPSTVNVTYDNGETITENLDWTTSGYSETDLSLQTLKGKINLPLARQSYYDIGTNCVTAPVQLTKATISSLQNADNTTELNFSSLIDKSFTDSIPSTVQLTLDSLSDTGLPVILNVPVSYSLVSTNGKNLSDIKSILGTHTFEGTLTLPTGVEAPTDKPYYKHKVLSTEVTTYDNLLTLTGKTYSDVTSILPQTSDVTFSNESIKALPITWDTASYNLTDTATQTISGVIPLSSFPTGYTTSNGEDLPILAKITLSKASPTNIAISGIASGKKLVKNKLYKETISTSELPATATITLNAVKQDGTPKTVDIPLDIDLDTYNTTDRFVIGTHDYDILFDTTGFPNLVTTQLSGYTLQVYVSPIQATGLVQPVTVVSNKPTYTDKSMLDLPSTVKVKYGTEVIDESVSWNLSRYDDTSLVKQTFTGTINPADPNYTIPSTVIPKCEIQLVPASIINIQSSDNTQSFNLTNTVESNFDTNALPTEVELTLNAFKSNGVRYKFKKPISYLSSKLNTIRNEAKLEGTHEYEMPIDVSDYVLDVSSVNTKISITTGEAVAESSSFTGSRNVSMVAYENIHDHLSDTWEVTFNNSTLPKDIRVDWDLSKFNNKVPSTYDITGIIKKEYLPANYKLTDLDASQIQVKAKVVVTPAIIESVTYNKPLTATIPFEATKSKIETSILPPTEAELTLSARDSSGNPIVVTVPTSVDLSRFKLADYKVLGTHKYKIEHDMSGYPTGIDTTPITSKDYSITVQKAKAHLDNTSTALSSIDVKPAYTDFSKLDLPTTLTITYDNGNTSTEMIHYNTLSYNKQTLSEQELSYTLNLPAGYEIEESELPKCKVKLCPASILQVQSCGNSEEFNKSTTIMSVPDTTSYPTQSKVTINALNDKGENVTFNIKADFDYSTLAEDVKSLGTKQYKANLDLSQLLLDTTSASTILELSVLNCILTDYVKELPTPLEIYAYESPLKVLPDKWSLQFSDNTVKQASVSWDTSTFDNTALGTAEVVGTILGTDLPTGYDLVTSLTVKAKVKIKPAVVTKIQYSNSTEVNLPYNAECSTSLLPIEVYYTLNATDLSDVNIVVQEPISVDLTTYNTTDKQVLGEHKYPIVAGNILRGIDYSTVSLSQFKVIVGQAKITSYAAIPTQDIKAYTPFSAINLPDKVLATTDTSNTIEVEVSWNQSSYIPTSTGLQNIRGTVKLPSGYISMIGTNVVAPINILKATMDGLINTPVILAPYNTPKEDLQIPTEVKVKLDVMDEQGNPIIVSVPLNVDVDPYNLNDPNDQELEGILDISRLPIESDTISPIKIKVQREEAKIVEILTPELNLNKDYGTPLSDILSDLESTHIQLKLNNGSIYGDTTSEPVSLTWDTSNYKYNKLSQTFTATIDDIEGISNEDEFPYKANLTLAPTECKAILSIEEPDAFIIPKGFDELKEIKSRMTSTVKAELSNARFEDVPIDKARSVITKVSEDAYEVDLSLDLSLGITNPRNLNVIQKVNVVQFGPDDIVYLRRTPGDEKVPNQDKPLPDTIKAIMGDGSERDISIEYLDPSKPNSAGVYEKDIILDTTYNNPLNREPKIEIDVIDVGETGLYVTEVPELDTIYKPVGISVTEEDIGGAFRVRLSNNMWTYVAVCADKSSYNPNSLEHQEIPCSLTLPTGVTNKLNLSVKASVQHYDCSGKLTFTPLTPEPVTVIRGTLLKDVPFPATAPALVNGMHISQIPTVWDLSELDMNHIGIQKVKGTPVLDDTFEESCKDKFFTLDVQILPNSSDLSGKSTIVAIEPVKSIKVPAGTTLSKDDLPDTVKVTLKDGSTIELPVNWDMDDTYHVTKTTSIKGTVQADNMFSDCSLNIYQQIYSYRKSDEEDTKLINQTPAEVEEPEPSETEADEPKAEEPAKELEKVEEEPVIVEEPILSEEQEKAIRLASAKLIFDKMPYTILDPKAMDWSFLISNLPGFKVNAVKLNSGLVQANLSYEDLSCSSLCKPITVSRKVWKGFSDMPEDHWAYTNVKQLTELGYINGVTSSEFRPKDNISVADTFTIIDRILVNNGYFRLKSNRTTVQAILGNKYNNHWAYYSIANITGKLNKSSLTTLLRMSDIPSTQLTREEVAEVLYELLDFYGKIDSNAYQEIKYQDISKISYLPAVTCTSNLGLFVGDNFNRFNPTDKINRAELSLAMYRFNQILK